MRINLFLTVIAILLITSCTGTPIPTPTSTTIAIPSITIPTNATPSKQPEPQSPLIGGQISGLSDNTLLTIHVKTPNGREAIYGTQRGNGYWETVVTDASGFDYVVTVEAAGYECSPISYTIHLNDTKVYVVEAGQITDNEAIHLDFLFTLPSSPSD